MAAEVVAAIGGGVTGAGASLEALAARTEEVKAKVYATVNAHYAEFVTTLNYTADLSADVAELAAVVADLQRVVGAETGAPGPDDGAAALAAAHGAARGASDEVAAAAAMVDVLETLAAAHALLESLDSALAAGNYADAAEASAALGVLMDRVRLESGVLVDARIFAILEAHYLRLAVKLEARVAELFKRGVRFDDPQALSAGKTPSLHAVTLTRRLAPIASASGSDAPVALSAVLDALATLDAFDDKLEWVANKLFETILDPLLANPTTFTVTAKISGVMANLRGMLEPAAVDADGDADADADAAPTSALDTVTALIAALKEAIDFISQALFGNNLGYMARMGKFVWPRLVQGIIASVLAPAVPSSAEELTVFDDVAVAVEAFELFVLNKGLVASATSELRDYVRNIDTHFAANKRRELVVMARELLLSLDRNTVVVAFEEERSPFHAQVKGAAPAASKKGGKGGKGGAGVGGSGLIVMPSCHVSCSTQTLVAMAWQTLDEAVGASPATARQLAAGARDLFDLFRALMPTYHASRLENDETFAALFHNDCMYLAHHCLLLSFEFAPKLAEATGSHVSTFVDLVPLFRSLGESVYAAAVMRARKRVAAALGQVDGFGGTHLDDKFDAVEGALQSVVHVLQDAATIWAVFPRQLYLHTVGVLVEAVLSKVTSGVLTLRDIAAAESYQLVALMASLAAPLPHLFVHGGEAAPAAKYVPALTRFSALQTFLGMDLDAITLDAMPGFSRHEVQHLVRALFSDTPRRTAKLQQLAQA